MSRPPWRPSLVGLSELRSCPRVFYPHSQGVLHWTRCIMGYLRLSAAISTAASKDKTPSAVAETGVLTRTPIDPVFPPT
jgi:hypothetical protein